MFRMSTRVTLVIVVAIGVGACRSTAPATQPGTASDEALVLALERDVALVLANEGFAAYAALFHPEYTNWSGGDAVLDRRGYLDRVRPWYDAGNRAVATAIKPVAIEIIGDLALSQYTLREDFSDGTAFVGRFASLARRHEGRWTLYRTSFSTVYRGARQQAPAVGS